MPVIVTRPQSDAQRWVDGLMQHGIEARALPLITVCGVADSSELQAVWARIGDFQVLMFVSAAAAEHFFAVGPQVAALASRLGPTLRCWATGPGTAAALRRCGVDARSIDAPPRDAAQFDSEALWAVVRDSIVPGARVMIVRGAQADAVTPLAGDRTDGMTGSGREWLAEQLRAAGARVDFVVAYCRAATILSAEQVQLARQATNDGSLWLFTSAQAIANLVTCLPLQDWTRARALATHARIAAAARAAGFGVVLESRPRLPDVVASIKSTNE